MRRFDKNKNIRKVNLLAEQRHLESKGLVKENIEEEFYKSRKPLEGYVDAEELIGKHLWFHTNRTHRNQGKNGMVGIYTVTSNGTFKDLTRMYTNEVRIQGPIYFQTSYKTAEKIQKSRDDAGGAGRRTLHAGVSGIVVPTDSGNTGGMEVAQYNPFDKIAPWFYLTSDSEKKEIISADEVYFYATESGEWFFYVTNPVFSGQKRLDLEDQEQSAEEPVEKELEANPEINEVEQKRNTMRKFDKNKNIKKANLLAEQRHLESKGLIKEEEYNIDSIKAQLGPASDKEMPNVMSALAMDDKKVTESEGDKYYLKDKNNLDNMLYDVSRVILSYVGTDKPKNQAIANDNRVIIQQLLDNGKLIEYLNQRIPSTGLHKVGYGADDKDPFLSKGKGIWANDEEAMINYMKQNYMNPDDYKIIGSDYFKKKIT